MRKTIDSGCKKMTLSLIDNIVYSCPNDLNGNPIELKMSLLLQNGNSEMRLATGEDDPKEDHSPKPALVWIPGGGWRGADKNLMLGEMAEFANAGYVVASIYYRSSSEGKWPAQMIDVKTAIRFLRANAEKYEINPDKIGVFGRSAGGHLAAMTAMNVDKWETGDNEEYSSKVQVCCDMFGPVDVTALMDVETAKFSDPKFRWHKIEDTHGGALIGGDPATIRERGVDADVPKYVNPKMAPILILHGDNDPLVPAKFSSEHLYNEAKKIGLEDRIDFYILKHAGHGSREFFQDSIKDIMIEFFDKNLK